MDIYTGPTSHASYNNESFLLIIRSIKTVVGVSTKGLHTPDFVDFPKHNHNASLCMKTKNCNALKNGSRVILVARVSSNNIKCIQLWKNLFCLFDQLCLLPQGKSSPTWKTFIHQFLIYYTLTNTTSSECKAIFMVAYKKTYVI